MRKNFGFGIALVVGLPLVVAAALYLTVNPEKMRPVVEAQLSQALRRPVTVEGLSFQVLPPSFRATGVSVGDDPAFSKSAFLTARAVEIAPNLLPLLGGTVEIRSLTVSEPKVELIQNAAQVWNFASLGARGGGKSSLTLGRLTVDRATVGVTQPGEPREEYSRLSAEIKDYAEGAPFGLKLSAVVPQGEAVTLEGMVKMGGGRTSVENVTFSLASLKGKLSGEMAGESSRLHLEIPKSPIADLAPLFLPKGVSVKGEVVAAVDWNGKALQGRVDVTGFEVSGGEIKQPVKTAKLGLELTPERITLEPANIVSGSTAIQAYGVVTKYASAPMLEATLIAPNAQVAELIAVARAYGVRAVEGIVASGSAKLQVRVHGFLQGKTPLEFAGSGGVRDANLQLPRLTKALTVRNVDFKFEANAAALSNVDATVGSTSLRGDMKVTGFAAPVVGFHLSADKLVLSEIRSLLKETGDQKPSKLTAEGALQVGTLELMDLSLTSVATQVEYRDSRVNLSPLRAALYGGKMDGTMAIDMRPSPPQYTLISRVEKIESGQLLAAATAMKGIVSGPMSANLNLKFSPADGPQMARSLNGTVQLQFDQGRIASFNLMNELALVGQFLGFRKGGEAFTQFLGIHGDLAIVNGNASTQNLKLDLANLTAGLTGSMNLADQTLDLKLMSILDKKFSEAVGGGKIGGFMTAAMANGAGNLMIPASIKGTFARPVMAPDPGAIAKMKLQGFNPKDPKQMMENVNSILDLFKKKSQ